MRLVKLCNCIILCCLMLICSATSMAVSTLKNKKINTSLFLESIEVKKLSKKAGDEIYIAVTEYSSLGSSKDYRIPEKPMHWLSRELPEVEHLKLWEGNIQNGEEVKIIFSVVEESEFPLLNPDDLIGSAEITIANRDGKLEKEWSIPVFEERVETEMNGSADEEKPEIQTKKRNKAKKKAANTNLKHRSDRQLFVMRGDHSHYRVVFTLIEH